MASNFCQDLLVPATAGKLALPSRRLRSYIRSNATS